MQATLPADGQRGRGAIPVVIALRLAHVWFGYTEDPLLRGVSLDVRQGETVALLGRNGAGKTTLTKIVMALLRPRRGAVWVGDRNLERRAPEEVARSAAYVFQYPDQQLFARTVLEDVAFAPRQQGASREEADALAASALRRVGLDALGEAHPYDLPPARRKLVTLAAAVAQRPRLLVLDEPTQGLDRAGSARVAELIRGLAREGVAVLAVTHDLGFVTDCLSRAVVLSDGTIAYDGPARELVVDAERVGALGLRVPPPARLSVALDLPGRPIAASAVAAALAERCRGHRSRVSSPGRHAQP